MKNFIKEKNDLGSILISAAPKLATKTACLLLFGEPKCPQILKDDLSKKE